jgi:hypothetical protein
LIRKYVICPLAASSSSRYFSQHPSQKSRPVVSYRSSASLSPMSDLLGFQLSSILESHIINSAMYVHTTNYCRNLPQVPYGTPNHTNFHVLTYPIWSVLRKYPTAFKQAKICALLFKGKCLLSRYIKYRHRILLYPRRMHFLFSHPIF